MFHPVHVSLLSLDYSSESDVFYIFLKVYFDDFLVDAGINSEDQKNLSFPQYDQLTKKIITEYVNEKVRISINNQRISAELKSVDLSDNELRINLYSNSVRKVKTIGIENYIMTSIYDDQENLAIIRMNDFEQGIKFTREETHKVFNIN